MLFGMLSPSDLFFLFITTFLSLSLSDSILQENNQLSGPLPTQLGKLTNLEIFYLDTNNFTGSIPTEIGLMTSLSFVDLRGNSLKGSIPSEMGLLSNLRAIRLEGNGFTGTIPFEVASLEKLEILTFDDSLTAYIPDNIKTMQPCVLCSGTVYMVKPRRNNDPYSTSSARDVDCDMLLEEQEDAEKPFSNIDCGILKEACVECTVDDNVFAVFGDVSVKNNDT